MMADTEIPQDWRIALELLQRLGYGGIVIGGNARIFARNAAAARLVNDWTERIPDDARDVLAGLEGSLNRSGWLRRNRHAPLIVHEMELWGAAGASKTLLVLIDPAQPGKLDDGALRKLFGLTAAESNLAVRLARGERVRAIAQARGVGIGTVRTQLRTLFGKTRTKSQNGLILLLARLAAIQSG